MIRIARVTLTPVVLLATVATTAPLTGNAEGNNAPDARPNVYTEGLSVRWRDWSWDSSVSLWDSDYSHSGNYSASCAYRQPWGALYFGYNPGTFNTAGYDSLVFYINGGTASGQLMTINLIDASGNFLPAVDLNPYIEGGSVAADTWRQVTVPLTVLLGTTRGRIDGIVIEDALGAAQPRFYIDDMAFASGVIPTSVPTYTPTETWAPTDTSTPIATDTPTETWTPTDTSTPAGTPTYVPTDTYTPTPADTDTPTNASTNTRTPTNTRTRTNTPTRTPTPAGTYTSTATPGPVGSCSLYASPSGSGSACSSSSPCSLDTANSRVQPGNTLCLMPGTYQRSSTFYPHGGTASNWVTYAGSTGVNTDVTIRQSALGDIIATDGASYITFRDFSVDGADANYYGGLIVSNNSHHVTVRNVYAHNTGEAGIYALRADYVTFDHNLVFHNGYNGYGWASGMGINTSSHYNDADTGFHYIFTNNVIAGSYDSSVYHTDGNGIIVDGGYSSQYTPKALIANNVVYSNGAACIVIYEQTGGHWAVNNTCYKNALDLQLCGMGRGCFAEFAINRTQQNYFVNNIARSWDIHHPYSDSSSSGDTYDHNLRWGTGNNYMGGATVRNMMNANPQFVNPPYVSDEVPTVPGEGWFWDALNPLQLGNMLELQAGSPAINAGIDPTTLTSDPDIRAVLQQYAYQDIKGVARPQGAGFDLGAYEYIGP